LLLSLVLFSSFAGVAQQPASASAQPAGPVSPVTVVRSPEALRVLEDVLTALGGRETWGRLHGARVVGTIGETAIEGGDQFVWEDHWQGKYKMLRQTHESGKVRRFVQDTDSTHTFQPPHRRSGEADSEKTKTPRTPNFDPVSGLVVYLPGAAIERVLRHDEYQVALFRSPKNPPDSECVLIKRSPSVEFHAGVEVALCASSKDHQPLIASIKLENLLANAASLREIVRYSPGRSVDGALVPTHIAVIPPSGKTKFISVQQVVFNPELDTKAFGEGAK
jgi:hypothetical protein